MNRNVPVFIAAAVIIIAIAGLIFVSHRAAAPVQPQAQTPTPTSTSPVATSTAEEEAVRGVVTAFGKRLSYVPLAGTPDLIIKAMQQYYAPYVSAELMADWEKNTDSVPGRFTSNPSPDHIEITSVERQPDGAYVVQGKVVETLNDGTVADTYLVALKLRDQKGKWVITGFTEALPARQ